MKVRVGRNIRLAREVQDVSRRELAKVLDVETQTIWRWEAGRVLPRANTLVEIASALGRDPGWFYADHEPEQAAA